MKFLCPQCDRLLPLERFKLDGAALLVTCSKCNAETRVEPGSTGYAATTPTPAPSAPEFRAPPRVTLASEAGASNVVVLRTASHEAVSRAAQAVDSPFHIPEGVCPKCLARRADTDACPHCGILFELFDESTVLPPKFLRDEWVKLLGDWGNEAKHVQFRRKAQQADVLPSVGRLYRLRQSHFPEDPLAAEALTDILRLAAVQLGLPRGDDEGGNSTRRNVQLGAVVLVGLLLLWLISRVLFPSAPTP